MLEQEEQEDELRQAEGEEEALQKRREDAMKEKDKKKEARELQKKMGRALIQTIGKDKQREEEEKEAQRLRDEEADKRRSPSIKKKTVAFAETTHIANEEESREKSSTTDWGDVVPARLHGMKRPTLLSQALLDRHPMKMSVVERVPGGQPTLPKPSSPTSWQCPKESVDSDDESDIEQSGNSDEEETDVDAEPLLDEDAVDLDYAQHQREIALQYYQKRNTIGQAAAVAMMNHSHDGDEDKVSLRLLSFLLALIIGANFRRPRVSMRRIPTSCRIIRNQKFRSSKLAELLLLTARRFPPRRQPQHL